MAAPFGNQFWKMLERPGRDKDYTPDELRAKAIEYFQSVDDNPYLYSDYVGKDGIEVEREKPLPYTKGGLCEFLNIDPQTFRNYETKEGYEAYFGICSRISSIIYNQKFSYAAIGLFNPAIMARDLGLVDKQEQKHEGAIKLTMKI